MRRYEFLVDEGAMSRPEVVQEEVARVFVLEDSVPARDRRVLLENVDDIRLASYHIEGLAR